MRCIRSGFLLLLFFLIATSMDWRVSFRLPPGYGAEGDQRRMNHLPRRVQTTVEDWSATSDRVWVKECGRDGMWVYELHTLKNDKRSLVRIAWNGKVISPEAATPHVAER